MIRNVHLHGALGDKFGKTHELTFDNPQGAIRALCLLKPGFFEEINSSEKYYKLVRGEDLVLDDDQQLFLSMGKTTDLHITPVTQVAGIETLLFIGVGLAVGAIVAITFLPSIKPPDPDDRENDRNKSFLFDGAVNVTEQGHPYPLVYGQMEVGSVVASASLDNVDLNTYNAGWTTGAGAGSDGGGYTRGLSGGTDWILNKGGKGGGTPRSAEEEPNSLRSSATAKVIDILCGGHIEGFVDPDLQSVKFDHTPVENADTTYNHQGVIVETRYGLPDQPYMRGFTEVSTPKDKAGVEVRFDTAAPVHTITDAGVDRAKVALRLNQFYKQDTENGDIKSTSAQVRIEVQSAGGGYTTVLTHTFSGKTNSSYAKDFMIELDGVAPWDIRVSRLTVDSTSSAVQDAVFFDTVTEIKDAKLVRPNVAYVGVSVDAKQFGSNIPRRSYEIKGLILNVPTNYDPVTRVYTDPENWNGTFKLAWTDNPAWVYYDLLVNDRYGLGKQLADASIDIYGLYAIARYCDELVSDGRGGQEPRYTFNAVINKRREAYDVLSSIAASFRGMSFWSSGSIMVTQDRPSDPVQPVNQTNVIDGQFRYEGAALNEQYSAFVVAWNDPEDSYRIAYEVIEDEDLQRKIGWKEKSVSAFGCTSRSQARRVGLWLKDDQKYARERVRYKAKLDHAKLLPGQKIEIEDPHFNTANRSGRLYAYNSLTEIELDREVDVSVNNWTLTIMTPNQGPASIAVVSSIEANGRSTLTLASNLPEALNAGHVWNLKSDVVGSRQFRVLSIKEDESGMYDILAVSHDPNSYARVEGGVHLEPVPFSDLPTGPLQAPESISLLEFLTNEGTAVSPSTRLGWRASDDPRVIGYDAQVLRPNTDEWEALENAGTTSLSRTVRNTLAGDYSFRVRAKDAIDRRSAWRQSTQTLVGETSALPEIVVTKHLDNNALQSFLRWNTPSDVRPLRYEVHYNATNNFVTSVSKGLVDIEEFVVTELGFYWVTTAFMTERSPAPTGIEILPADLPSVDYADVTNAPTTLADLDSGADTLLNSLPTDADVDAAIAAQEVLAATARQVIQDDLDLVELEFDAGGRVTNVETENASQASSITTLTFSTEQALLRTLPPGIAANATGAVEFIKNSADGTTFNSGEIWAEADFIDVAGVQYTTNLQGIILAPFDTSYIPPDGVFYVMFSVETALTRVPTWTGANVADKHFMIAVYDAAATQWKFVNNQAATVDFTPIDTDRLVAIGTKTTTAFDIVTLDNLISNTEIVNNSIVSLQVADATHTSNITQLQTDVGNNTSAVTTAQSTADGNATAITTLEVDVGNAQSDITTLYSNTGTNASLLTTLESELDVIAVRASSPTMEDSGKNFTYSITGRPEDVPSPEETVALVQATDVDGDYIGNATTGNNPSILSKEGIQFIPGHTYKITADAKRLTGSSAVVYLRLRYLSGNYLTNYAVSQQATTAVPLTKTRYEYEWSPSQAKYDEGARIIRAEFLPNASLNHTVALYHLNIEDITDLDSARSDITTLFSTTATNASAITTLDTDLGNAESNITNLQTTTGDNATAITTLEAQQFSNGNLIPNSTFSDGEAGWAYNASDFIIENAAGFGGASLRMENTTGTTTRATDFIPVSPNQQYTLSYDALNLSASNTVYADLRWYDASFVYISETGQTGYTGNYGADTRITKTDVSPANAAYVQVRIVSIKNVVSAMGMRRMKLEFGTVATEWTDEATAQTTLSRITSAETVNATNAAAILQVETTAGNALMRSLPPGISANASGDFRFVPNSTDGSNYNAGEMYAGPSNGGHIDVDGVRYSPTGGLILGNMEGAYVPPDDVFYIIFSVATAHVRTSFDTAQISDKNFIPAIYEAGQWKFIANSGATENFTPLDTDRIVAIGTRTGSTGDIESLDTLISDTGYLDSSVTVLAATSASHDARLQAHWSVETAVPGAQAFITAQADLTLGGSAASTIAMGADQFMIYSTNASDWELAMDVQGNDVTFHGDLNALGNMRFGTQRIPVALQSFDMTGEDGDVFDFGGDLINIPQFQYDTNGLEALASGESYQITTTSVSSTGFTLSAKIVSGGTPTNYLSTGSTSGSGGEPTEVLNKSNVNDASSGAYTFNITYNGSYSGGEYSVAFILQVRPTSGGAWSTVGSTSAFGTGSGTYTNKSKIGVGSYGGAIGTHAEQEFGVDVADFIGTVSSLSFTVSWAHTSAGSTVTASPNGETMTVKILPQNS